MLIAGREYKEAIPKLTPSPYSFRGGGAMDAAPEGMVDHRDGIHHPCWSPDPRRYFREGQDQGGIIPEAQAKPGYSSLSSLAPVILPLPTCSGLPMSPVTPNLHQGKSQRVPLWAAWVLTFPHRVFQQGGSL